MPAYGPPAPPPALVRSGPALSFGFGWPEVGAIDVRFRPEERIAVGAWFALNGPIGALQATPMAYLRYFFDSSQVVPFIQFGAGTRLHGLFGGAPQGFNPLMMASYGFEWRDPSGFLASADLGGAFDFSLDSSAPLLRVGLRMGYQGP